jgi:RNA polymerase sigma-70 factor, ECF subfamily
LSDHSEDRALVEQMLGGDSEAFEAFGDRYFRPIHRFALGRLGGDRELALEIVQTTLARALARIESYRGEASLLTWLCACCRNEIRMHFRAKNAAPREVELDEEAPLSRAALGPPPSADPERDLLGRETRALVHVALDAVPEHYGRVLEWKYLENLPVQQIAERLTLGTKAAESLLTRARAAFRKVYAELGAPALAALAAELEGGPHHE